VASSAQKRIQQLTARMLRKNLYVVLSKGATSPEPTPSICRNTSNT
jgi:hypothetical protein